MLIVPLSLISSSVLYPAFEPAACAVVSSPAALSDAPPHPVSDAAKSPVTKSPLVNLFTNVFFFFFFSFLYFYSLNFSKIAPARSL